MKRPQLSSKQQLFQRLNRLLGLRSLTLDAKDTLALQMLAPLSSIYLPWSRFSLRPSALVSVLNEIQINRKTCIVECGCGLSTFYIAQLLKQTQKSHLSSGHLSSGHLYSIEHDLTWLNQIQDLINSHDLSEYVTLIHAPLSDCSFALNHTLWYNPERIQAAIATSKIANPKIDLLLIDGPPAYDQPRELARYPAVPFFKPLFSDNTTIVLDDINRAGEQRVVQAWEQAFGLEFEEHDEIGGIAIARLNSTDSYVIS
jgi:hypothetical protein